MKLENILRKKVKDLEVLSNSLVYKEKELLIKYQDQLEESDLEDHKHYEKKNLLDDNSSDEETNAEGFKKFM